MKSYIELTIKKKTDPEPDLEFSNTIQPNTIVILLGAPGSGKTSMLKNYHKKNKSKTSLYSIQNFLSLTDNDIKSNFSGQSVLLLDGLDEHRHTAPDRSSNTVMFGIAQRISKLSMQTIVISCREMDWYGDVDTERLQQHLEQQNLSMIIDTYHIQPLDGVQKQELAELCIPDASDRDAFLKKFNPLGFLECPQTFTMAANTYPSLRDREAVSKQDLFNEFIKWSNDQNTSNIQNGQKFSDEKFKQLIGYLAVLYIFSNAKCLSDNTFLDNISDETQYAKKALEQALSCSSLFNEGKFVHRMIAEFSAAWFLNEVINQKSLSTDKIKAFFGIKDHVPTEFRGTYAWVCSTAKNTELLSVDPHYQLINGDCSMFDPKLKQDALNAVRDFAKDKNPFFYNGGYSMDIGGFYDENLDEFLKAAIDDESSWNTHYIYLILAILNSAAQLSESMVNYVKEKMHDKAFPEHGKWRLVNVFIKDTEFVKDLADRILLDPKDERHVPDKTDRIKEAVLKILYPNIVKPNDVVPWLLQYKSKVVGYCYYLYRTPYENKKDLIKQIYQTCPKDNSGAPIIPENVTGFIQDYFLETLLKYPTYTAEGIYAIIEEFLEYYPEIYEAPIHFESYRVSITNKESQKQDQLKELTKELYERYIQSKIEKSKDANVSIGWLDFSLFFSYMQPDIADRREILLNSINSENRQDINQALFRNVLGYSDSKTWSDKEKEQYTQRAKALDLADYFDQWINPKRSQWDIERDQYKEKRRAEIKERICKNEEALKPELTKDTVSIAALHFIAQFYYTSFDNADDHMGKDTQQALAEHLKHAVFNPSQSSHSTLLTLDSLVENSIGANRKIDIVYYVSVCKNSWDAGQWEQLETQCSPEFRPYLYINYVQHSRSSNVIHSETFLDSVPDEFAQSTLIKFFKLLARRYCNYIADSIADDIPVETLKQLIDPSARGQRDQAWSPKDIILNNSLNVLNVKMPEKCLDAILSDDAVSDKNKQLAQALHRFIKEEIDTFTQDDAVQLFTLIDVDYYPKRFDDLESDQKVWFIYYMMLQFPDEKSLYTQDGYQSDKDWCASFIKCGLLYRSELKTVKDKAQLYSVLETLKEKDLNETIWPDRISHRLHELDQESHDNRHQKYSVEKLKNKLIKDAVLSDADFFVDVYEKLEQLKKDIEANRGNDKGLFYNDKNSKKEESCRDAVVLRLEDRHGEYLAITKEKHEANHRVDIHISSKDNWDYQVQVECKKDTNQHLMSGIQEQLIKKYLEKKCWYGIYLVFLFKENENDLLKKLKEKIPDDYKDRIKILIINCKL